jgi:hypothetical protein
MRIGRWQLCQMYTTVPVGIVLLIFVPYLSLLVVVHVVHDDIGTVLVSGLSLSTYGWLIAVSFAHYVILFHEINSLLGRGNGTQ